ncbi:MAG: GAF domain-containing protein [Candidatus Auribacter fodinae]|jgi:sigma-B regulation protein RsbU (phosphoserine phosphatase)|uniref:GAF domain-containing protein n=1 Tax=Candidatus Auribacter fodinae TaxID=2093366 RepID=A0A3A4QTM2_9BACT|nr:MAG: GAF domain-containing protein [Candidatus Auribacter fodinae]
MNEQSIPTEPLEKQIRLLERTCARQAEKIDNFQKLIKINEIINSAGLEISKLLTIIMSAAEQVMQCAASSLMLIDEKTDELVYKVALGEKGEDIKEKFRLKMGQGIAGWVAQNSKPLVVPDVRKDPRFYSKPDEDTGFQTRSILCVPMKVRNKTIGILQALNPTNKESFSKRDLPIFTAFANQAAVAIENANVHRYQLEEQRLRDELTIAQKIQQNILPGTALHLDRFECCAKNQSAKMVGGDFYDFIQFDQNRFGILIGDVSGKGVPAALFMVSFISSIRFYSQSTSSPAELFYKVNSVLNEESTFGMFVTAALLMFDLNTMTITFTNAGHLPPYIRSSSGTIVPLKGKKSLPLGILKNTIFEETVVPFHEGEVYILYTDGVTEARSKNNEEFGIERLTQAVCCTEPTPTKIVESVFRLVTAFSSGTDGHDDITVLAAGCIG